MRLIIFVYAIVFYTHYYANAMQLNNISYTHNMRGEMANIKIILLAFASQSQIPTKAEF